MAYTLRFDYSPIKAIKTKNGDWFRVGRNEDWALILVTRIPTDVYDNHLVTPWFDLHSHSGSKLGRKLINSDSVSVIEYD